MAGSVTEERRGPVLDEQELLEVWRQMPQLAEGLKDLGDRVKRLECWLVVSLFMILLNLTTSVVAFVFGFILKKI